MTLHSNPLRIAILALLANPAYADQTHTFNIPAQPLGQALQTLADQSGSQMLYAEQSTAGKQSPALKGTFSTNKAANLLLADSGLAADVTDNGTVTVKPKPANRPTTTLKQINVVDKAMYISTDPYNEDYVLPNATSGTKTDTPIMETPLNVQVISKQVLKDQQVINLSDALKNVSGVTTTANSGDNGGGGALGDTSQQITLRGFRSETYFRNGFRLQGGASSRNMSNIESVEVAKGPAAILYGLVEPGGMINVITKQPLATPYYSLNQQFGSFANYRTTIDTSGPLTKDDTLLYRLNASYQNSGSFQDFAHKEDFFIAPVLKWNISPRTQATVEFEYNRQNLGTTSGFRPIVNGQIIDLSRKLNYGERAPGTVETFYGGFNWSHAFNDDWQVKHHLSINQSNTQLNQTSLAYGTTDTTTTRSTIGSNIQTNTYATGIDLTGHFKTFGLEHTLLLGGDYYRTDTSFTSLIPFSQFEFTDIDNFNPVHTGINYAGMEPVIRQSTLTDQYGFYVQDQIKLPYDVHVMGGIRYQNFHQSSLTHGIGGNFVGFEDFQAGHDDAVTPRVGILWQPQKWLSLYANYVESFGVNSGRTWVSDTQFKLVPSTGAKQYEGGIKTEFFNGRLRANLAYFDLVKTNIATNDPAHFGYSLVAGAVQSRGYEFDVTGEILPGWNAIATYSNTDAKIIKSNEVDSSSNFTGFGVEGARYWGVPRNVASLWNTYEFQQGNLLGLKFGGGVTVRSGQVACCNDPAYTIPGYATVDLLTAYSRKVGKSKVTVQLNVNNLLDKHYYTGLMTAPFSNAAFYDFGTPRSFMGSIGIQF